MTAPTGPRVSDERLDKLVVLWSTLAQQQSVNMDGEVGCVFDLRDARARIAELENDSWYRFGCSVWL